MKENDLRRQSLVAEGWWDYTTLDSEILDEAEQLSIKDLEHLDRDGLRIVMYDNLEDFYLTEALEYIPSWRKSTASSPAGICGPIGPTEQLPLVARVENDLNLDIQDGREVSMEHPLSFARANREFCFDRIRGDLRISEENIHFITAENVDACTSVKFNYYRPSIGECRVEMH